MTNSTSSSPSEVLTQIAEAFFAWVHSDIFPVCTAAYDIIAIIVGLILNTLLIVSFKKRGLFNEPSTLFVLMLCVVDFLAYAFLLLPNIITAVTQKWILSDPVCKAHGFMMAFLMFAQFLFLVVLCIERTVKLTKDDSIIYDKIFESDKKKRIIVVCVWLISCLLSGVQPPLIDIRYDFFHHGCMLDYNDQPAFLIVNFILSIVATTVCFGVCYGMIFRKRHDTLKAAREAKAAKRKNNAGSSDGSITEPLKKNEKENAKQESGLVNTEKSKQTRKRRRRKHEDHLLIEVFSDDAENPAFHLSITYLSLWTVIIVCYFPYFFAWFFNIYNTKIWGGIFNIILLALHTGFVIKPIIYLGHNRHYRYLTKQTLPETVRTRARTMRSSISSMADKMENFLFRSPSYKKLDSAFATHKAVLIWKRKMKKNTGLFKINEGADDIQEEHPKNLTTTLSEVDNTVTDVITEEKRPTLTPSGINVSTTATISFIERERMRLRPSPLPGAPESPEDSSSSSPNSSDTTALVHMYNR